MEMKTSKLFHVLVLAGGALAAGCSSESTDPRPQTAVQGSTAAKDKDAGADDDTDSEENAPTPPTPGAGSHFW